MARVRFEIDRYLRAQRAGVERAMRATALQGEAELKVMLSTPGLGEIYPRGKTASHRASAPGQPPAPDTGRLRASTTHEVIVSGDEVRVRVSDNTQYGLALELGTEKIAPRPALRPTLPKMIRAARLFLRRYL